MWKRGGLECLVFTGRVLGKRMVCQGELKSDKNDQRVGDNGIEKLYFDSNGGLRLISDQNSLLSGQIPLRCNLRYFNTVKFLTNRTSARNFKILVQMSRFFL